MHRSAPQQSTGEVMKLERDKKKTSWDYQTPRRTPNTNARNHQNAPLPPTRFVMHPSNLRKYLLSSEALIIHPPKHRFMLSLFPISTIRLMLVSRLLVVSSLMVAWFEGHHLTIYDQVSLELVDREEMKLTSGLWHHHQRMRTCKGSLDSMTQRYNSPCRGRPASRSVCRFPCARCRWRHLSR